MHLLKKAISLLLVVAMLSSFALVASAEGENLLLEAYRADGTKINAGETVTVGEKIKVRIVTTDEVICNAFVVLVSYDSNVLKANKNDSTYGDIASSFNDEAITVFTTDWRDEEAVPIGTPAIQLTLGAGKKNITAPAGTVWAEFDFTALAETTGTALTAHLTDGTVLKEVDHGEEGTLLDPFKLEGIVPGSVTLGISAAPVPVETVTLSKDKLSLAYGASEQLTANIEPDNAADKDVTWTSEPEEIVSVVDGLVTGLKAGTATVTATAGGKSATCAVTVAPEGEIPVTGVSITGKRTVAVSKTGRLYATVTPSDATHASEISWTSSAPDVATVEDGATADECVVRGKAVGTAVITATAGGCSATFTVQVNVPSTNLVIDPSTVPTTTAGSTFQLKATVTPANTTDTVIWTSSAPTVASVDQNGLVTALSAGTAKITAKASNFAEKTLTVTVIDLGSGDYTVAMPGDQTIKAGEKISLPITVDSDNDDITSYNAYKLVLEYDPDALTLLTTALEDDTEELTDNNGEVEIVRYGAPKTLGNMLVLEFEAKAITNQEKNPTTVTLKSAQVDISTNALENNAPNATIKKSSTVLTIEVKHFVELPDDFTSSQGNYVDDGKDYTFTLENPEDFYDYDVSATMGDSAVTVRKNEDGSYTIENVTDTVKITLAKTPKTYQVTFTGEDVTGAESATYGTDYVFKVDKKVGFKYEISAKIAGQPYTGELAPDAEGNYKIPGAEIKGAIEIVVTKTEDTSTTTFGVYVEGTGASDVDAPARATKDTEFTFTVNVADGYIYTVDISVGGTKYTGASIVDSADGKKTYTIPAADVTGQITIVVAKDKAFGVTFENADPLEIKAKGDANGKVGSNYSFTITGLKLIYKLNVTVKENGVEKTFTVTKGNVGATRCDYTYTVENVRDDLTINLSYSASNELVEIVVNPFVELDGKTVYLVATRTKAGNGAGIKLDTYDGYYMYKTNLYVDKFNNAATGASYNTYLWLTIVNAGESFTIEDAMNHLSYTNGFEVANPDVKLAAPEELFSTADVNHSGFQDINDAQLVWDIYNNGYKGFCITNNKNGTYLNPQEGASMTKFLDADVNKDMCVNALDAAAVIAKIK